MWSLSEDHTGVDFSCLSEASEALAGREGQMKAKRCFFGVCHLPNLLDMRVGLCQKRKQLVLR